MYKNVFLKSIIKLGTIKIQVDNAQDTLEEAEQVTDEVSELVNSRINEAEEIINGLPSFDFDTEEPVTRFCK